MQAREAIAELQKEFAAQLGREDFHDQLADLVEDIIIEHYKAEIPEDGDEAEVFAKWDVAEDRLWGVLAPQALRLVANNWSGAYKEGRRNAKSTSSQSNQTTTQP